LGFGCIETDNSLLAEMVAIKRALEYIVSHNLSQYEIELHCDVISIIKFFNENNYKNFLAEKGMVRYKKFVKSSLTVLPDIVGLLDSIKTPNIKFIKVKSKKDRFNNIVHTYAVFARSLCNAGKEYIYELQKIYELDDVISTNNYAVNNEVINTGKFK